MNFFRPLTLLLATIPILVSCSLFQPKEKVIEYDEEVKLHDGSMIWVHIKRHYVLVGGALGDPGAFKKGYAPKEVEISWDTGFPNVGRKSVFFDDYVGMIDKYNNKWYVFGFADGCYQNDREEYNLEKYWINAKFNGKCMPNLGTRTNNEPSKYASNNMYVVNKNGEFEQNFVLESLPFSIMYNLFTPDSYYQSLAYSNKKISWIEKLHIREVAGKNAFKTSVNPNFKLTKDN